MSFSKILIANRGEIACRVMRTAHALGYRTVAVYSDADADAPHVKAANEAVRIGPPPAAESYLNIDAILDAARRSGADAVHPGYGFLSENADFARACTKAGLVFIGPPADAIAAMGDKAGAKQRMQAAGVPVVPGYFGADQSDATLAAQAQGVGFPLLAKAVAGGGGRGMRLARDADELQEALASARREAHSAFGDGRLMLERLIDGGRHIEIQVFADAHGNAVHLGERDCTAQRRRQKVIEETPSPILTSELRSSMGRDAVAAALAVGYRGAGTIEFIVDADLNHYFLEMNTRLQVEHPVTEMVTGLDLVEWQLRIAAGESLPLRQGDIRFEGHAIEARLYAEDPYTGFAPQTGRVLHFRPGEALPSGVRIDTGIVEGGEVTPWYDPLLAKFVAHGHDREDAIRRLRAALADAPLLGIANNGGFLRDLLDHADFRAGRMDVASIDGWSAAGDTLVERPGPTEDDWLVAAALLAGKPAFRPTGIAGLDITLACGGEVRQLRIGYVGNAITLASGTTQATLQVRHDAHGRICWDRDGVSREGVICRQGDRLYLARDCRAFVFHEPSPVPQAGGRSDPRHARAAVAGTVARIEVSVGDGVRRGQTLAVIEAMKMEMRVTAAADGTVASLRARAGSQVAAGALLVELEIEDTPCLPTTRPS